MGYPHHWVTLSNGLASSNEETLPSGLPSSNNETLLSGLPLWIGFEVADSATLKIRNLSTYLQDAFKAVDAPTCKLLTHMLAYAVTCQ